MRAWAQHLRTVAGDGHHCRRRPAFARLQHLRRAAHANADDANSIAESIAVTIGGGAAAVVSTVKGCDANRTSVWLKAR